jgi:hypothetical protein
VAAAAAGELMISDAVWPDVRAEVATETRLLSLKGIEGTVPAHAARVGGRG